MAGEYSRARALQLLEDWTKGESLRKHGLAVSVCTEAYGVKGSSAARPHRRRGRTTSSRIYASAGLLHDMDYERHPSLDEHPFVAVAALREQGWPEPVLRAILAHADYSGVTPRVASGSALFACDELAGFLTACALVKPTKSIRDVEVRGVLKKMKDKAFARAVKREDMTAGAALLGLSIEEHVGNCLAAMQARAEELGLAGHASPARK